MALPIKLWSQHPTFNAKVLFIDNNTRNKIAHRTFTEKSVRAKTILKGTPKRD